MVAPLSSWPWDNIGSYKYVLYGPLIAQVLYSTTYGTDHGNSGYSSLCLHLLIISALRGLIHQLWFTFSSLLFLTRRRRVQKDGVDFEQIDKEWDWDNFLILQAYFGAMAFCCLSPVPLLHGLLPPLVLWDTRGLIMALVVHVGVSEPLFYWTHRLIHKGPLFDHYHSLHHSSKVLQSFTAGFATPLEHLVLCGVIAAPVVGTTLMGFGSLGLLYGYVLFFDFMRCMGHSNVEVFPSGLFDALPFLRYIVYTPTYHSLHHMEQNSNFCLFMPLFDVLGGTLNPKSWELQKEISSEKNDEIPDFVFLVHIVDLAFSTHTPFLFRSYSSMPYSFKVILLPFWPLSFVTMLLMWAWSKTFLISFYKIRGLLHQTWVVPRYGFQYFLPFAKDGINDQIELAILRADKMGIKVLSLAALNKNEALNGGGTLFVDKHPNLKVRVVHGNTLTAAVILNEIPTNVREVCMTGATSKLGRAIALYLCRKKIRVMMLTLSTERFVKIQKEASPENQQYLVQVTKYQAAQNCKTWIVGKWLTPRQQRWAPSGTHFHQFVVPPIFSFRRDCTYGKLAAMRLPKDVEGLGVCEYTLDRGVVHACHAGGVVHSLEGWTHHEVGAIDVDRIDVVWNAAMKNGLTPA